MSLAMFLLICLRMLASHFEKLSHMIRLSWLEIFHSNLRDWQMVKLAESTPGPEKVSGCSLLSVSMPNKSRSCSTPKITFDPQNSSSSERKSELAICGVTVQVW